MRVLALGDKDAGEEYRDKIKGQLDALSPSLLLSDLAYGWNLMVAEEAARTNIPILGVFPHEEVIGKPIYKQLRKNVFNNIKTKVVFNDTFFSYLKNPQPYVKWLIGNVDVVYACVDTDTKSLANSILTVLRQQNKRIFNSHPTHQQKL